VLSEVNEIHQLKLLRKATKIIATVLVQDKKEDPLCMDTELFKHLLICSSLSERAVLYLVEALIDKYSDKSYYLCYVWNAVEFISSVEEKNDKKHDGSFLMVNIVAIKENTMKILPSLLNATADRPGLNLPEKM
jgi:hypothetical protein